MINQNVITALQSINPITNTVVLKYPTTVVNSSAGDIIAKIDISELDSEQFDDLGVFDLGEFLNVFKLFGEDRSVKVQDKNIIIEEGTTSVNYISTNISLLDAFNKKPDMFEKTEAVPTAAEFNLTEDVIKQIKQASGVFKDLTEVIVESKDGEIKVTLGSTNSFNAKSNGFSIVVPAETSKEFTIKVPSENFNTIPVSNYNFLVKYNSAKDAYRIILKNTEINMDILLAVKK